jgi:hypothetical protein
MCGLKRSKTVGSVATCRTVAGKMCNWFTFREMVHKDVEISLPTNDVTSHGAMIIVADDSASHTMAWKMSLGTGTAAFHATGD